MNPKNKINSKEHSRRWKALTPEEREEYNEKSREEKAVRNARIEKFKKGEAYSEDEVGNTKDETSDSETEQEIPEPVMERWSSDSKNETPVEEKKSKERRRVVSLSLRNKLKQVLILCL